MNVRSNEGRIASQCSNEHTPELCRKDCITKHYVIWICVCQPKFGRFKIDGALANRQIAKINSPPTFPAIRNRKPIIFHSCIHMSVFYSLKIVPIV